MGKNNNGEPEFELPPRDPKNETFSEWILRVRRAQREYWLALDMRNFPKYHAWLAAGNDGDEFARKVIEVDLDDDSFEVAIEFLCNSELDDSIDSLVYEGIWFACQEYIYANSKKEF